MKKIIGLILLIGLLSTQALATGTAKDVVITAASTNVQLTWDGGSRTAKDDTIGDDNTTVALIQGLVNTSVDVDDIDNSMDGSIYAGLVVGTSYNVVFSILNRGNQTEQVTVDVSLDQVASRWTIDTPVSKSIAQDVIATFEVTVNPTTAWAYEYATLNVIEQLSNASNVVSYNAFAGATGAYVTANSGANSYATAYGGVDNISLSYVLRAQGIVVNVISRTSTIKEDPLGGTDAIPGAVIEYEIVIQNSSSTAEAIDISISDVIPDNTHLFYSSVSTTDNVAVAGDANSDGSTLSITPGEDSSAAATAGGQTITFANIDLAAQGYATINYTVTID